MKNFFVLVFSKCLLVFKDDLSATAVVAYFLSLNIFTAIGYYKLLFQHSSLEEVPLYDAFIIMLLAGAFAHFVLLKGTKKQVFLNGTSSIPVKKGVFATISYMVLSFSLMLGAAQSTHRPFGFFQSQHHVRFCIISLR